MLIYIYIIWRKNSQGQGKHLCGAAKFVLFSWFDGARPSSFKSLWLPESNFLCDNVCYHTAPPYMFLCSYLHTNTKNN